MDQDLIKRLRDAADNRVKAEAEYHSATAALRKCIQEARTAGYGPTQIAAEARLSRQAVYEALGQRPS